MYPQGGQCNPSITPGCFLLNKGVPMDEENANYCTSHD